MLLSLLMAGALCFADEQPSSGAVEKFEPVFDVGVVYQPKPGEYGITELMNAALDGNSSTVESLILAGADIDSEDDGGATALLRAAAYGHLDVVNQLLAAGADPEPISREGRNALSVAVEYKSTAVALTLLRHGANPDAYLRANRPEWRSSVLRHAAVTGQTDVVVALIENGADVSSDGPKALNAALWQGHTNIAAALINAGVDVNVTFGDPDKPSNLQTGRVALQTAAQGGHVDSVSMLLRHGAKIEATNFSGQTALHYAVRGGHVPVVRVLLTHGAAVSAENVSVALATKNSDLARTLMEYVSTDAMSIVEIESLIDDADRTGEDDITTTLFAARALLLPNRGPPFFLFARSDVENCALVLWRPNENVDELVYEEPGACASQFFVGDRARWLYVLTDGIIQMISLDNGEQKETVAIPTQQIDENLEALKIRVSNAYGGNAGNAGDWMAANIVQVGRLASGQLALVTHTGGPADETYGIAYAHADGTWQLVEEMNCGRFDRCRFPSVLGQPLNQWPSTSSVWHPNVRTNPYFVSKSMTPDPQGEWAGWVGTIVLQIDGKPSALQYSTSEGGHCSEDCVYTAGLRLQLADKAEIVLAEYGGNNAIVDRYALVWRQPRGSSELIDLATGESVFGKLQLAGWFR